MEFKTNRQYKDRLFRLLFGTEENKENLLSLYNALNGTDYSCVDDLTLTTIDDVIYMKMKNDVSCMIGSTMQLYEQQSSYNPNMPCRMFEYCAKLYDKYITVNELDLYGKKLVKIPAPKCFILYNGPDNGSDREELKLSDAFEVPSPGYEWTAYLININSGHNRHVMEQCGMLKEYSDFVEAVRINCKDKTDNEKQEALDGVVCEFIKKGGLLAAYLKAHRSEVIDMCITEYNEELHERTLKAEGREEGRAEGIAEGRAEGRAEGMAEMAVQLIKDGLLTVAEGAKRLQIPEADLRKMM